MRIFIFILSLSTVAVAQEHPADFNDPRVIVLEKEIGEYHEFDQEELCKFARKFAPEKYSQWQCEDFFLSRKKNSEVL